MSKLVKTAFNWSGGYFAWILQELQCYYEHVICISFQGLPFMFYPCFTYHDSFQVILKKTLKTSILNKTFETKVVANVNLHPSSKFCISIFVCLGAVNILHIFLQFKVLLRFWKKCKTKMFHNPFSCWSDNHCGMTFQKYEFHSDGMSID